MSRNPNHAIFRPPYPEDSCITAMQLANERCLERKVAQEEKLIGVADESGQEECQKPNGFEANDDDLPMIFFVSADT